MVRLRSTDERKDWPRRINSERGIAHGTREIIWVTAKDLLEFRLHFRNPPITIESTIFWQRFSTNATRNVTSLLQVLLQTDTSHLSRIQSCLRTARLSLQHLTFDYAETSLCCAQLLQQRHCATDTQCIIFSILNFDHCTTSGNTCRRMCWQDNGTSGP